MFDGNPVVGRILEVEVGRFTHQLRIHVLEILNLQRNLNMKVFNPGFGV
jgi:hypothetical protein